MKNCAGFCTLVPEAGGGNVVTLKPKTQKAVRTGLWLLLDAVLINLAMILSQVLRYTTTISYSFFQIYFRIAPAMTLMGLILFAVFGLYRTMWQYASAEDLLRVVLSTLALAVCTYLYSVIANYFVRPQNLFRLHRLIYPLFWLISMALVGASRLIYRYAVTRRHFPFFPRRTVGQRRTMIVGAGWLGANVVHEMQHGNYGSCVPVIVVDDDQQRTGSSLSGVPVVRGSGNILKLASDYSVDDIIIAISTPKADLNPVIEKCLATGCRVKRVTPLQNLEGSRPSAGALRELNIGDLLGRPEEQLDMTQVAAFVRDKTILITGGGGSIGSELCRQLFPLQPKRIVLYDISENYMYDLYSDLEREYRQDLSQKLILCVGSIRDEQRLDEVFGCYKPEIVLHAAAHKRNLIIAAALDRYGKVAVRQRLDDVRQLPDRCDHNMRCALNHYTQNQNGDHTDQNHQIPEVRKVCQYNAGRNIGNQNPVSSGYLLKHGHIAVQCGKAVITIRNLRRYTLLECTAAVAAERRGNLR